MLKRIAAVVAVSLVPAGLAAAPAQAYGSCDISVPSKVTISSPFREIPVRYSSGCRRAEDAWWDVVHPTQGLEEMVNHPESSMDWYDWNPLGTYRVRPDGAYDADYDDIAQNTRTMSVRAGTRLSTSSARSGRYVTVKAYTTRYSPSSRTYRNWPGATATLSQKACSSCAWKVVKTGKTNRYGRVSLRAYASSARYWKVQTKDTSVTWGRTTSTFRR